MGFEIHMYMAVAKANTASGYTSGECHPALVFLRQPEGSEHDLSAAERVLLEAGWDEVDFTKAGTLPKDAQQDMTEPFGSRYRSAVELGQALLIYDTVVKPAPRAANS
ncbi:MAG: hypothetical protein ACT4PG_08695 [Panacagrimonas sp.]